MNRKPRIEMQCEDMGTTELTLSPGANGCGFSVVLAHYNSASAGRTLGRQYWSRSGP